MSFGINHSLYHNGWITKFIVGEGFPLPPGVLVKSFVHGQLRTSVPAVFVVYSTVDREILIVLFVLKCSLCWDYLIRHGKPCHLPQGEGLG